MKLILGFQEPTTPLIQGIINLHDTIFIWLFFIFGLVVWMLLTSLVNFYFEPSQDFESRATLLTGQTIVHGTLLEIFWTVTPSLILMAIAFPSFSLLYSLDEVYNPSITWIAIGNQWYWEYQTTFVYYIIK